MTYTLGTMSKRAAIYVRISSDPAGERAGVERQRLECEALAKREGWEVVDTFEDNDTSAYSGKPRPAFEALIAEAQAGAFEVVIAWATDRLYRRMRDLLRITDELAPHAEIATVKGGEVDLTTAEGILKAQMMGTVAEFESRRKGERVAARARQRAEQGRAVSSLRPFGWAWAVPCPGGSDCEHTPRCEPGSGRRPRAGSRHGLQPHPVEAEWLQTAYAMIAEGASLRSTTRHLRELGATGTTGRPLDTTALRSALLQPRNAGRVAHKGEVVAEADAPALVSVEQWENVRAIVTDPARRTSPEVRTSTPLGGGLLRCGRCGGPMSASVRHYGGGASAPVYLCSRHHHLSRRRALLDGPILELARGLLVTLAESGVLEVATATGPDTEPLRAEVLQLEQRLETLGAMVADDDLDPADYAIASKRLRGRLGELRERLATREGRPASARLLTAEAGVGEAFDALVADAERGDPDALRAVLREVFAEVVVDTPEVPGHPSPADVRIVWADWVPAGAPTRPEAPAAKLSAADRRLEVARLSAEGLGVSAIAERLGVYRGTIRKDLAAV